ncbi:AGC/PDK1 protein kinase [Coprinopsis marcescibilis]|uniref:non-specific serine/threonine protein kinase n=1 Tax=Coprinopsis marcescibilis TaxID=230819 RepID=A0A5C3L0U4_COPMA|nr:AGC/PDK1 protein kinase [Coprinopsis marcescibilis]
MPAGMEEKTSASQLQRPPCLDDFEVGEEIAWGSLATIVEATHKKSGKIYAIKILNKMQLAKKKMVRSALAEKDALVALSNNPHPGIVRLAYCFQDVENLYFAEDLAPNGDLKTLTLKMGSLSLDCSRYYAAQMLDAILWMHDMGVSHRDIKPENCLLDHSMRIKIADFGSAYVNKKGAPLSEPRTNTFVGTAAFLSPDVLLRLLSDPRGPDLWALGACLFFYLFGTYPFAGATDYLIMEQIKKLNYTIPDDADSDAKDIIKKLLVLDPSERLGLPPQSSVDELMQHPFFVGQKSLKVPTEDEGLPQESRRFIDWDKLWAMPPPELKSGARAPRSASAVREDNDITEDLWAKLEEIHLVQ